MSSPQSVNGEGTHGDSDSAGALLPVALVFLFWLVAHATGHFFHGESRMVTLNHTNLTTFDVPALTQFFCSVFAFQVTQQRTDKLAVLQNSDGFLLTLMYDKQMSAGHGYPGMFHIGFRQPTPNDVDSMHAALTAQNYAAPKPEKLQRGGPAAYGFYCNAPGGVVVEVSTMNIDPS